MKKLLLHICCAPDGIYIPETLSGEYDVTCLFYNPNIFPEEEFEKRADAMKKAAEIKGYKLLIPEYNDSEFSSWAEHYFYMPEKEGRCSKCFRQRLEMTAKYAEQNGFDSFGTVLTVSPLKNQDRINRIGKALSEKYNVSYLASDFKKNNGYRISVEETKAHGIFRQDYCGCQSSLKFRQMFKDASLSESIHFVIKNQVDIPFLKGLKQSEENIPCFVFYEEPPSVNVMKTAYDQSLFLEPSANIEWRRKIFRKKKVNIIERSY